MKKLPVQHPEQTVEVTSGGSVAMTRLDRRIDVKRQRARKSEKFTIDALFVAHTLSARRVLDRLEQEHAEHGGYENGNLICTYDDFARAGVRRQSVSPTIQLLVELGFVEVTAKGRAAAEFYTPSHYRLTYLHNAGARRAAATHDWKNRSEEDAANAIAKFRVRMRTQCKNAPPVLSSK